MPGSDACCVMLVEDEFYLAKDVQQLLQHAGFDVMGPFPGHAEAAEALEQRLPHCAILDVNLGQGASFELADQLRARGAPFLFFTGYDREVLPPRFADVPRLEKPVDSVRLVDAIRTVCSSDACVSG